MTSICRMTDLSQKHPYLMVEVLSLAAKSFSEELHSCLTKMDTERATEMTGHLETCLGGLRQLKETLVLFPDVGCKA